VLGSGERLRRGRVGLGCWGLLLAGGWWEMSGEWGYLEGGGRGGGCSYLLHAAGLGVVGLDDGE